MAFMSILARLGLDSSGFQAGVKQAESAAKGLGKSISSELKGQLARAFSVAAVVTAGKAVLNYAGQITDLSDRLGISTDELQRMDYAARLSGTNLETMTGFLEKLSVAREEALEGNEKMVESFARLGVSMDDLKNRRLDELIKIIGRTVQAGNAQSLLPALRDVGGKSAGALIPTFKAGLEETGADAPIISAEDIAAIDEADHKLSVLAMTLRSALAPAIVFLSEMADDAIFAIRILGSQLATLDPFKVAKVQRENPFDPTAGFRELYRQFTEPNETSVAMTQQREDQKRAQAEARAARLAGQNAPDNQNALIRAEQQIQKLRDAVADKELNLLPAAERRVKLEEKAAKLRREATLAEIVFGEEGGVANERKMLLKQAAALDAEAQLKPEKPETEVAASFKVADPLVNSLERIGFSFGKSAQPAGENFLKEIAKNTKDTAKFGAQSALASTQTAGALT